MTNNYKEAVQAYEDVQGSSTLESGDSYIFLLMLAELKDMREDIHNLRKQIGRN